MGSDRTLARETDLVTSLPGLSTLDVGIGAAKRTAMTMPKPEFVIDHVTFGSGIAAVTEEVVE